MADEKKGVTVVTPLTMTDFVKALNELIEVFRSLTGLAGDGVNFVRRHSAEAWTAYLDKLGFTPGGFRDPLERIAGGKATEADFSELQHLLDETLAPMITTAERVFEYRDTLRVNCGREAAHALDELIEGVIGKYPLRRRIGDLARWSGSPTSADVQAEARNILDQIANFNENLNRLHDMALPPRGAPK